MNEIVYNILRKCVESPEKFKFSYDGCHEFSRYRIYISDKKVLSIGRGRTGILYTTGTVNLTDKECRRILRGMEHVQAMRIRRL